MKLKQVILTAAAVLFIGSPTKAQTPAFNPTEMEAGLNAMADSLTANLTPWQVPARDFDIRKYGAQSGNKHINTRAIQRAIDACAKAGGGRVVVRGGDYVTGTIVLRSGVMLHIDKGARLLGSTSLKDYPDHVEAFRSVCRDVHRYRISLIYAERADRVGISGEGEIDFRGSRNNFPGPETVSAIEGRPFGIRMIECKNVVVKDVQLRDAAAWMQCYLVCENLIFDGMRVVNQVNWNNDGLDLDGCRNVIVRHCNINSHDDALCLKTASGRANENFLVEDNTFHTHCNAFKFGTDSQGAYRRVVGRRLVLGATPQGEKSFNDIHECSTGITLATTDGGNVSDVLLTDISITGARAPIYLGVGNRGRRWQSVMEHPGKLHRIVIKHVLGMDCRRQGSLINGCQGFRVSDVLLKDIHATTVGGGTQAMADAAVEEKSGGYPDAQEWSREGLPAYGFYVRHAERITFDDVKVKPGANEARPHIRIAQDCEDIVFKK
ncbi:MAG: glycosyl hydrolase family 28 protein [Prevotella sp.]|nr:glycosyl hydrolase family 28 protein [Prevotella sp.]MDD7045866.1 glycosyl hydrolase family 28 protein [Prevotella sp.]